MKEEAVAPVPGLYTGRVKVVETPAVAVVGVREPFERCLAADLSTAGDLGCTRGTYESPMLGPDGQQLLERGKWVLVWKRQADGQWRIVVDIFNTDTPPPIRAPSTVKPGPP